MIVAVDFDGTIVEHRFPEIGEPVPGAIEWLKKFDDAGIKIILWTMRSDKNPQDRHFLTEAMMFCQMKGIKLYGANKNPGQDWSTSPKAYAHVYIDDAAFGCPMIDSAEPGQRPMVDWSIVGPAILEIKKKGDT